MVVVAVEGVGGLEVGGGGGGGGGGGCRRGVEGWCVSVGTVGGGVESLLFIVLMLQQ